MRTLDEISLADNDRAALLDAARVLLETFPVEQVVLFGSKARGEDDAESDIDLLVLTARPTTWSEHAEMVRALSPIQRRREVLFNLLVVARNDWTEGLYQVLPIRREVDRDGVRV